MPVVRNRETTTESADGNHDPTIVDLFEGDTLIIVLRRRAFPPES